MSFPAGTFFEILWNITLHCLLQETCPYGRPLMQQTQTLLSPQANSWGVCFSDDWNTFEKQNKTEKASYPGRWRDVCILESSAIRVHDCLLCQLASFPPPGAWLREVVSRAEETSRVMSRRHTLPEKVTFHGAPSPQRSLLQSSSSLTSCEVSTKENIKRIFTKV